MSKLVCHTLPAENVEQGRQKALRQPKLSVVHSAFNSVYSHFKHVSAPSLRECVCVTLYTDVPNDAMRVSFAKLAAMSNKVCWL